VRLLGDGEKPDEVSARRRVRRANY